jgi:rhodanese-related sulfurtransferase
MVENLVHAGLRVTLIEKLPQICPLSDPDMAPYLHEYLEKQQVTILAGRAATAINGSVLVLDDDSELSADLVIMAVGVRPMSHWLVRWASPSVSPEPSRSMSGCRQIYGRVFLRRLYRELLSHRRTRFYRPLGPRLTKMGRIAGDVATGGSLSFRGIAGTGIFQVFEMSIAASGLNEAQARASGYDIVVNTNIKPDKPEYYGGREMVIKAIADRKSEKLLGVQIIGYEGVDKRIDVFVTAMTAGLPCPTVPSRPGLCPAVLDHQGSGPLYRHDSRQRAASRPRHHHGGYPVRAFPGRDPGGRRPGREAIWEGHVDRAVSMPHEVLRERMLSLDKEKPVVTYCNKGTTGNAAQNILINHGFKKVYNLSGGNKQYQTCKKNKKKQWRNSHGNQSGRTWMQKLQKPANATQEAVKERAPMPGSSTSLRWRTLSHRHLCEPRALSSTARSRSWAVSRCERNQADDFGRAVTHSRSNKKRPQVSEIVPLRLFL